MRVLLDQGFPNPPGFKPAALDATVEYIPLVQFAPELAKVSTPDWMVILAAARGGFDALAVDDQELKDNELCLIALCYAPISLIAWTRGIDAVTGWAQLVAYAPKIAKRRDPDACAGKAFVFRILDSIPGQGFASGRSTVIGFPAGFKQ